MRREETKAVRVVTKMNVKGKEEDEKKDGLIQLRITRVLLVCAEGMWKIEISRGV